MTKNGLFPRQGLSELELAEIFQLADQCDTYENIQLKLNRDMLRSRSTNETNDFLFYHDDQLVGFLGIYIFRSTEAECCGMVHPDFRRKGIFTVLVKEALEECTNRQIPKVLFISHNRSQAGKAFCQSIGATYSFSEYWMDWKEGSRNVAYRDDISLVTASLEDVDTLVALDVSGFNLEEKDAREYVLYNFGKKSDTTTLIAILDNQPIGKINVLVENNKAFIYGFSVAPDLRGRGYGRQILNQTIDRLLQKQIQEIALDVAAENKNALALYQSCGFHETGANEYYVINCLSK
ncbi:GNAT family N-acetyltransferase [Brevibacillus sp. SYSU BS000544]|uniref:GNAT family N-acetyltransferase n=1 Tax=Brevibacillus sp. SYSU BS000544 TaxID=3416443 RepID=UPI003CE4B1BA